jgi:hypothetical protein
MHCHDGTGCSFNLADVELWPQWTSSLQLEDVLSDSRRVYEQSLSERIGPLLDKYCVC